MEQDPAPNKKWSSKDFKKFLSKLLKKGNVNRKHRKEFLTSDNLKLFKVAFTHPSLGESEDYNIYEFVGDPIVNSFIAFYIRERFPGIIHVKWYSRLKSYMQSDVVFAKIARDEGFERFVRYGEDLEYLRLNPELDEKNEYMKMMEDVLEAFFGCLATIIIKSGKLRGVAVQVCESILRPYFDKTDIPLEYEVLFDPVTILKEMYEDKSLGLMWPNDQVYLFQKHEGEAPLYTATVYGWPLGNRTAAFKRKDAAMAAMKRRGLYEEIPVDDMNRFTKYNDPNKTIVGQATAKNKKEAKMEAAREALKFLKNNYNIVPGDADPYKKKRYDSSKSTKQKIIQSRI